MKHFDFTLPTPAENLACDEALLDWREENSGACSQPVDEILRFWESSETFVVVGYANKIAMEVNVANCEAKKVPILRRCSGGGTVLQGRGCLNYALILRIAGNSPTANISSANQFIMERNRAAVQSAIGNRQSAISVRGHTDLALVTRHSSLVTSQKFSGNSQRRHKNFLLFHGTFLLNCDLPLISELLQMPSKQPDYRANRNHAEFLTNLDLPAEEVKAALKKVWTANAPLENPPMEKISSLGRGKYATHEWHWKF